MTIALTPDRPASGISKTLLSAAQTAHYAKAEAEFMQLLRTENLDQQVNNQPELVSNFSAALTDALEIAYLEPSGANAVDA
ncbi:MAG TPA: iron-containing redox enzyme family protein, partial [Coleofasciculaceae cyanobacterium]